MAEATSSNGFTTSDFLNGDGSKLDEATPEQLADQMEKLAARLAPKLPHLGLSELHVLLEKDDTPAGLVKHLPAYVRRLRVVDAYYHKSVAGWPRLFLVQDGTWLIVTYDSGTLNSTPFTRELMIEYYSAEEGIPMRLDPSIVLFAFDYHLQRWVEELDTHRDRLMKDWFWVENERSLLRTVSPERRERPPRK